MELLQPELVFEWLLMRPVMAVSYWYDGMHHWIESPPPPAPAVSADSFHTVSPPLGTIVVPPTAMTLGELAGKLSSGVALLLNG